MAAVAQRGYAEHVVRAPRGADGNRFSNEAASSGSAPAIEGNEAWLTSLLEEQRRISERQIAQQHELLRRNLEAFLRPLVQGANAPGDLWDPDLWEPESLNTPSNSSRNVDVSRATEVSVRSVDVQVAVPKVEVSQTPQAGPQAEAEKTPAQKVVMSTVEDRPFRVVELEEDEEEEEEVATEPPTWIQWFMGMPLDIIAVCLILLNTLFMMMNSMWVGYVIRLQLGLETPEPGSWESAEELFEGVELLFTIFFFIELVARLWWSGMAFLRDPLNVLDALVVLITTLDSFVFSQFDFQAGISCIRLIRLLKLFKTFRFAKAMKMVEPMRILIRTIAASVLSLFWSMCILFTLMLVTAILASQMVQGFIQDEANDLKMRLWCEHHYGNVLKSLWTMFMITMSGGWPNWVAPLVHEISIWYALFFGTYVTMVVFAIIRVITALFLQATLKEAAKDAHELFKDQKRKKEGTIRKLEAVFACADKNKDGVLSEPEFKRSLRDPKIMKMFYEVEMEPFELEGVFHLLDDGNGEVELDEFLSGIMKMKGHSRATDLLILQHDNRKMLHSVQELEAHVMTAVEGLETHLCTIQSIEEKMMGTRVHAKVVH